MDPVNRGKTIWEMLCQRLHGTHNGEGVAFENPLDLRTGSPVAIAYSNGPEFADYSFAVQEIQEYNRIVNNQSFRFTDYVLKGTNTKSFDAGQAMTVRLRAMPNDAGAHDTLLLRLYDEFAFTKDFLDVVNDSSGVFEAKDDNSGATDTFSQINEVRESWQAAVLAVGETTPDGKGTPGKTSALKVEYWDYWRDADIGSGNTAKEFLFVEMNSDSGWFQLWRGREFFT